ncbi:MAG: pyridoxal-phosphate dependent enzyme [Thermovirgaceae bacterium]
MPLRIYCPACGKNYEPRIRPVRCACGQPLSCVTDWEELRINRAAPGMWRYGSVLPRIAPGLSMGEGWTPLIPSRCRSGLMYKLEFMAPTGSFKDRGAVMVISDAIESDCNSVVVDSSGNAGASVAAYAARAGIKAKVVVPEGTSDGKKRQIAAFGAEVLARGKKRSETATFAWEMAKDIFYASHVWNPLFLEGTKTVAFEIWEQSGHKTPEVVISPAGNGTLLLGLFKGFKELLQRALIDRLPRLVAAQAEKCAPLKNAFSGQKKSCSGTCAEGIAVSSPPRLEEMLKAVRSSRGDIVTVSDAEIIEMKERLAKDEGLYVETTAAVAPAAEKILRESGRFRAGETVVVPLTGSGLKSQIH